MARGNIEYYQKLLQELLAHPKVRGKVNEVLETPLDYDVWEEDCSGYHEAFQLTVFDSGIGSSFKMTRMEKSVSFGFDDDGEVMIW